MNRSELVNLITQNFKAIDSKSMSKDTQEWYLHNHLERLLSVVKQENNPRELLEAGNKFVFFCTDSMNWDTLEFKKLVKLGQIAIKIAKAEGNK